MSLAKHWKSVPLGTVSTFAPKKPLHLKDSDEPCSFVPMASVEEESGVIHLDQTIGISEGLKRSLTYFNEGDVLFAKVTPCMENGKIAVAKNLLNGRGFGSSEFHVITPGKSLNAEYLRHFLVSEDFRTNAALAMTGAVGLRRVPKTYLQEHLIPLPPLDEQVRVVQALDSYLARLDVALEELQSASRKSEHLFLGALDRAIADCPAESYKPLSDFLVTLEAKKKVQRGWSPQCLSHPKREEANWAVLKTTAVQHMRYEPQHNKELPKNLNPKTHLEVQHGDFLMTTTGPRNRCGVVCYVPCTPEKLIFSGKILRFRTDPKRLIPQWLELVLASNKYQKHLDKLKVGSSDSSVSIGNNQVLSIEVPVPPLDLQSDLIASLEKIKVLSARFEREILSEKRRFDQLRRGLLNTAFSGNLGIGS
jgi:type I restriction enzyme S subunit